MMGTMMVNAGDRAAKTPTDRRRVAPPGGVFSRLVMADGTGLRFAVWRPERAARGTVLVLHGRREFIEKYFETVSDLLDRGFAVATFDWRGQGLSDRPLADRHKGHVRDFRLYVDDLANILARVQQSCPAPVTLLAHSMGGHIALRALSGPGGGVARAIFCAPMLDIALPVWALGLARPIVRVGVRLGCATAYALLQRPYSEGTQRVEADLLSSDPERLEDEILACRENPDLALGGVTYGWLHAAWRSSAALRGPGVPEAISTPSAFVIAGRDRVVRNDAIRTFAARMPVAEVHEIADARHEILKERNDLRQRFWQIFDDFTGRDG